MSENVRHTLQIYQLYLKNWKVKLATGGQTLAEVKIKNGISR